MAISIEDIKSELENIEIINTEAIKDFLSTLTYPKD